MWFHESATLSGDQKLPKGQDDIYVWITYVDDSFCNLNKKYVRGYTLMGLNRFGKCKDGKPGCYYETIVQTDVKLNSWTSALVAPLMPKGFLEWGTTVRAYLSKKQAELKNKN